MRDCFNPDEDDLLGHGDDDRPALTDANGEIIRRFPFYKAGEGLPQAINVALALGRPLLVSGEPGCGKTSLGFCIARKLGIPRLYFFSVKSDSEAKALFYNSDTLRRFQDAQIGKLAGGKGGSLMNPKAYITYQALGRAILDAHPLEKVSNLINNTYEHPVASRRSVVIIDEIDKAPRDFPNDVLDEIERLVFRVPELDTESWSAETPRWSIENEASRPIVVITSNSEKQLPDAFLRRCIYHHIKFPSENILKEIAFETFRQLATQSLENKHIQDALDFFLAARRKCVEHRPGTAEFLDLCQAAVMEHRRAGGDFQTVLSKCSAAIAKTSEDVERLAPQKSPK